mgnify:CR=1 FL=1
MDLRALLMGLAFAVMWASAFTSTRMIVTEAPPLPPLPLGLPDKPRGLSQRQQIQALTWTLRTLVLTALMLGVGLVQRSVLAGLVVPAIVLFALTLGRRFAVDWDGLIDRYERWEHALVRGLLEENAREAIRSAPWVTIFPGLAVFLTVLGFNLLGDGLRDALDPKLDRA